MITKRFKELLEAGLSKAVFDHVRNFLICSLLFAAGFYSLRHPPRFFLASWLGESAGWTIIVMAALLLLLTLADGIARISSLKHKKTLIILLILLYVFVSLRFVTMVVGFRSA